CSANANRRQSRRVPGPRFAAGRTGAAFGAQRNHGRLSAHAGSGGSTEVAHLRRRSAARGARHPGAALSPALRRSVGLPSLRAGGGAGARPRLHLAAATTHSAIAAREVALTMTVGPYTATHFPSR